MNLRVAVKAASINRVLQWEALKKFYTKLFIEIFKDYFVEPMQEE